jgi:hypothetical protein
MKFDIEATVHFTFEVEADSQEAAEALLAEQLGENWVNLIGAPEVDHPQIEHTYTNHELVCLVPVPSASSE